MGAELFVAALIIPDDVPPDWTKARDLIDQLTESQVRSACNEVDVCVDENMLEQLARIKLALARIADAWDMKLTASWAVLHLANHAILIAADKTWGDPVDEVDDIVLFEACGAAKAAGFLQ